MMYVSHPYTGDEMMNRKDARNITAHLSAVYTDTTFINPLDTFQALESINLPYEDVLTQCLELLTVCQGIVLTGDWESSRGCILEYQYARKWNIPVYCLDTIWHAFLVPYERNARGSGRAEKGACSHE